MLQVEAISGSGSLLTDSLSAYQQPSRVIRIMSGDPSRGAISIDMEDPLRVGQQVQVSATPCPASGGTEADSV